jgi:hypothetical protein
MRVGKTIFVNIYANVGSDPSGPAIYFTSPVTPKSHASAILVVGSAYGQGTGLSERLTVIIIPVGASSTNLIGASVIGTNWGTAANEFRASFVYEAA